MGSEEKALVLSMTLDAVWPFGISGRVETSRTEECRQQNRDTNSEPEILHLRAILDDLIEQLRIVLAGTGRLIFGIREFDGLTNPVIGTPSSLPIEEGTTDGRF